MTRSSPEYSELRLRSLAGGLNDTENEVLLRLDESPDALNVEFNRETVASSRGALKFGNQIAPRSGFRTSVDESFSPLFFDEGKAVPLRGYGYIPYQREYDVGGGFQVDAPVAA